jgi:hypothetical protein
MATKDLSRTVIEGGRARFNSWERRHSHRLVRARERIALSDGGDWDNVVIARRTPVRRAFADKLSAAERYLAAQVGRPWSKVSSELFARFDTRTTAGRHILFDHLLREVKVGEQRGWPGSFDFEVDRHGLLRRVVRPPRQQRVWHYPRREWLEWLAARRIGRRGGVLFWFVPTAHERLRQAAPLSTNENAYWSALPDWFRQEQELRFPEEG